MKNNMKFHNQSQEKKSRNLSTNHGGEEIVNLVKGKHQEIGQ